MLVLVVLDVLVLLDGMLAQTCGPTFRPVCKYQDQRLDSYQISHLMNFILQRCALECLLVKKCASFNHRETSGICELNNVSLTAVGVESLEPHTGFQHYDIREWDPAVCREPEMFSDNTFRVCVVDCGRPRSYSETIASSRVRLTSAPTVTTIGSSAVYDCNDPLLSVSYHPTDLAPFLNRSTKICNSDYQWSINQPRCLNTTCNKYLVSGPTGVEDDQLSQSTYWCEFRYQTNDECIAGKGFFTAKFARLNSTGAMTGAWIASLGDVDQYIQVDFLQMRIVSGIALQGRDPGPNSIQQWVTRFKVLYSRDCQTFLDITDDNGAAKIFDGNTNPSDIVIRKLPERVVARCIRINPREWRGWYISLRFDVLGC